MPRLLTQRQENFPGGKVIAVEPQRIPMDSFERILNWDIAHDGLPEAAPGYATEFSVPRSRQIVGMEDDEDAAWILNGGPGTTAADKTNFEFGFQSKLHVHAVANTQTSILTTNLAYLGSDFVDADLMHFWFFVSNVANITSIRVRFRNSAGVYFQFEKLAAALVTGANSFSVARSTLTAVGGPSWSSVVDVFMESISSAALNVSFDNFTIDVANTATQDPIVGLRSYERLTISERFLAVASSDAVYTYAGATKTRRIGRLATGRQVHMLVANDMLIACNGLDPVKRLDLGDTILAPNITPAIRPMRNLGVPVPPNGFSMVQGAAGTISAGTYHGVVVFDMGRHGEGNPNTAPSSVVLGANRQINYGSVTPLPIGPPGTVRRLIYRTIAGAGADGSKFLDVIINDNSTTTATSNNPDSSLGTTALVADANQPPALQYMVFANNTIYGANGNDSKLFFSDRTRAANRTIEQWRSGNVFNLDPDDGDIITGLFYDKRYVHIFKRFSHFILDPQSNGNPVKVSNVYGTVSQRSITSDGQVIYFWSPRFGPMAYTGGGYRRVGLKAKAREEGISDVEDINGERIASSLNGLTITTQADFKRGVAVFTDTNADDFVGDVALSQAGNDYQSDDPLYLRNSTLATQSDTANGVASTPEAAKDNDPDTGWQLKQIIITLPIPITKSVLTMDFGSEKKISRIEIDTKCVQATTALNVQYRVEVLDPVSGSFVVIGTFVNVYTTSQVATFVLQAPGFSLPYKTQKIRVEKRFTPQGSGFFTMQVTELKVYEQGFLSAATYETDKYDLGVAPLEWGKLDQQFVSLTSGDVVVKMKSAATAVGLDTAVYVIIPPNTTPDTDTVPLNQHVRFFVEFISNVEKTPRLQSLALTFKSVSIGIIRPLFESNGLYFEDRWWLCPVRRGATRPSGLWKYEIPKSAFTEHSDYDASCWENHAGALFSGNNIDGRVIRHVKNIVGNRLLNKDGRQIPCLLETTDYPFGFQEGEKTILDYLVAARNEDQARPNLVRNGDLEDWGASANFWFTSGVSGLNQITQETDPRNVLGGRYAAKIDKVSGASPLDIRQQILGLRNSTAYTLVLNVKSTGTAPNSLTLLQTVPFAAPVFLKFDGTWGVPPPDDLGSGTTYEARYNQIIIPFVTRNDVENSPSVYLIFGFLSGSIVGTAWLDSVAIYERPNNVVRRLFITPILDGIPMLPRAEMNLVGGTGATIDLAVRKDRFRIDRALVRNMRFQVEHIGQEARAKLMGLYVHAGQEKIRDGA
jgi:hypothetical protein